MIVAANILGEPREAHYEAVSRVAYTDPQAAAVGATEDRSARPSAWRTSPDRPTRAYRVTATSRCSATANG